MDSDSTKQWLSKAGEAKQVGSMDAKSGHNLAAAEQKTVRRHLLLRLDGLIWAIH